MQFMRGRTPSIWKYTLTISFLQPFLDIFQFPLFPIEISSVEALVLRMDTFFLNVSTMSSVSLQSHVSFPAAG